MKKENVVSIIQPAFFPWIGYFDIIKKSDFFVFFDNVKFEKRNWQMRNRLKIVTKENEDYTWISMPTKGVTSESIIKDVLIDNSQKWKIKHLNMFQRMYGNDVKDIKFLMSMYEQKWEKISDFNIEFIKKCCTFLEIKTKLIVASELNPIGKKSSLLLDICKKLNATKYLSGPTAKIYLENDKEIFEKEGIEIKYHDYKHPIYNQCGKKFLEKLSVLDLIFNEKENAKRII
jgi:hypothetical protein